MARGAQALCVSLEDENCIELSLWCVFKVNCKSENSNRRRKVGENQISLLTFQPMSVALLCIDINIAIVSIQWTRTLTNGTLSVCESLLVGGLVDGHFLLP